MIQQIPKIRIGNTINVGLTFDIEVFPTGQTIHVPSGSQAAYIAKFPEYTFIGDL